VFFVCAERLKKAINSKLDKGVLLRYYQSSMRIILVHGFNSSPEMNFHPWLANMLRKKGYEVITPTLPLTRSEFDLTTVIETMQEQVGYLKGDDIVLGHSLGALIVLQYLEAVEMSEPPRAVVLVAPPWNVTREEIRRLFIADLDADVLMWKAREFFVVHSRDDKLVPLDHGKRMANALKAKLIEVEGENHFMDAEHPVLAEVIEKIANKELEYDPGQGLEDAYKDVD